MAERKPELTKAEREKERAAVAAAKLRARCEREVGVPCSAGCMTVCQRRQASIAIGASRLRAAVARGEALGLDLKRRTLRKESEEQARLASFHVDPAIPAEAKATRARTKAEIAIEKWRTEVLFILGLPKEKIALALYGDDKKRVGAINAAITKGCFVRARETRPVDRLIELDRTAPKGFEGVVASDAARFDKAMLAALIHRRGIVPERQVREEGGRALRRMVNQNASALHVAARGGDIREWNLLAGMELQSRRAASAVGRVGSADLTSERVDGGRATPDGRVLSALEAAEDIVVARATVIRTFETEMTGLWRWAVIEHVALNDRPLAVLRLPTGLTDNPALFLNDALEPLALLYGLAPSGIRPRQPSEREIARFEAAKASDTARRRRLFGG